MGKTQKEDRFSSGRHNHGANQPAIPFLMFVPSLSRQTICVSRIFSTEIERGGVVICAIYPKNDYFTKTGSGQTWENRLKVPFSCRSRVVQRSLVKKRHFCAIYI
jgi:hypothetical protein